MSLFSSFGWWANWSKWKGRNPVALSSFHYSKLAVIHFLLFRFAFFPFALHYLYTAVFMRCYHSIYACLAQYGLRERERERERDIHHTSFIIIVSEGVGSDTGHPWPQSPPGRPPTIFLWNPQFLLQTILFIRFCLCLSRLKLNATLAPVIPVPR